MKDIVAVGTPHPKKGVALNPKVLGRRLTDINEMLWKTTDMSEHSMPSLVKPKGLKTKRKVLLATPEECRESEFLHRPGAPPDEELVGEGVSPRLTHTDCEDTMCSICEEFQEPQLSFAERRKISQEGEYTIAKYGRKMSDIMMAAPNANQEVDDKSVRYAKKASLEMERYMRSQGLVKISNDQVTMTRNMARISTQIN
ncbi:uncharacterized protein LOC6619068 isoform X2 [Drosophila sechellia]|nr:uncharacterized protein LOC6619068 isoform X2 [Drosophila sechellia]